MSGFYLMERGWQEHPLFDGEPYSLRDAWEWLIANACYKDVRRQINGTFITLKRGQLSYSVRFLAEKFLWSKSKVDRFLKKLKTETMIGTAVGTGQLIITICNYNDYQTLDKNNETVIGTVDGTRAGHERDTSGTKNNESNESNKEDITTLQTLVREDISDWLLQQEMIGNKITIDVRMEIERFRSHFTSSGGKDKYGKKIEEAQWIGKLQGWILNEQKQQKYGGKSENNRGNNQSGQLQNYRGEGIGKPASIAAKSDWDAAAVELCAKIDRGEF